MDATAVDDKLTATINVTNSGKTPGREVVQLYLGRGDAAGQRLIGFVKTRILKPGQTQRLTRGV